MDRTLLAAVGTLVWEGAMRPVVRLISSVDGALLALTCLALGAA